MFESDLFRFCFDFIFSSKLKLKRVISITNLGVTEKDDYFEWWTSYSKVRYPEFTHYDPKESFGHFASYNVETRDRVKCINGRYGLLLSIFLCSYILLYIFFYTLFIKGILRAWILWVRIFSIYFIRDIAFIAKNFLF